MFDPISAQQEQIAREARDEEREAAERVEAQIIAERDLAEDAFNHAFYLVMGEAIEHTNLYGYGEALRDMERRLKRERAKRES